MGVKSFFHQVGNRINNGINKFKQHARYYIPKIKRIAPYVVAAGGAIAKLPAVHPAINAFGVGLAGAGTIAEFGAIATETALDAIETHQKDFGWETEYKEDDK